MIKIYQGKLVSEEYGDAQDVLFLSGMNEPLLEILQEDIEEFGNYISVRYFIMNKDLPVQEIEEYYFKQLTGFTDIDFTCCYSETTGYLYTTTNLTVGGHDLLAELENSVGYYIILEIEFNKEG